MTLTSLTLVSVAQIQPFIYVELLEEERYFEPNDRISIRVIGFTPTRCDSPVYLIFEWFDPNTMTLGGSMSPSKSIFSEGQVVEETVEIVLPSRRGEILLRGRFYCEEYRRDRKTTAINSVSSNLLRLVLKTVGEERNELVEREERIDEEKMKEKPKITVEYELPRWIEVGEYAPLKLKLKNTGEVGTEVRIKSGEKIYPREMRVYVKKGGSREINLKIYPEREEEFEIFVLILYDGEEKEIREKLISYYPTELKVRVGVPDKVTAGEIFQISVTLENNSNGKATNVRIFPPKEGLFDPLSWNAYIEEIRPMERKEVSYAFKAPEIMETSVLSLGNLTVKYDKVVEGVKIAEYSTEIPLGEISVEVKREDTIDGNSMAMIKLLLVVLALILLSSTLAFYSLRTSKSVNSQREELRETSKSVNSQREELREELKRLRREYLDGKISEDEYEEAVKKIEEKLEGDKSE